jgi:hypothetical protein
MGKWILIALLGVFCLCCFGESIDDTDSYGAYLASPQNEAKPEGNPYLGEETPDGYQASSVSDDMNPFTGTAEEDNAEDEDPTGKGTYGNRRDMDPYSWEGNLAHSNEDGFFSEYERLSVRYWRDPLNYDSGQE